MTDTAIYLLKQRRFFPLFITQFLGAFNDNFFKNALVILITYTISTGAISSETMVVIAGGLFILPYFIFSATAGQLADKYEKAYLIRITKFIEIIAMVSAAIGFYLQSLSVLLSTLFFLGTQSAFFGPLKYSILPDHLNRNELIGGNALIEASTFLAILIGTILGGILITVNKGDFIVSIAGIVLACCGFLTSFLIPKAHADQPQLKVSLNVFRQTWLMLKYARQDIRIFLAILGISWFWLVGAVFLAEFPSYSKYVIGGKAEIVTLFLALFAIGIGVGSILCERLAKGEVSARYVPIGIFGMTLAIFDLYFASPSTYVAADAPLLGIWEFSGYIENWRIMLDIFAIAVFGGLYIVPLYAMMQVLAPSTHRSRVIAANNIVNALFMVVSAVAVSILFILNVSITTIILLVGIINFLVAIIICKLLPRTIVRSILRWVFKTLYRVEVTGVENIKKAGKKAVIISNHVSFLDAALFTAFLPKKVFFAINTDIAKAPWVRPFLSFADTYSLDPLNPMSIKSLIKEVNKNKHCVIFPEGRITITGSLMKIYEGPGLIADSTDAKIIPIRIDGAQYSAFSRLKGKIRTRWFPKITLTILPATKIETDPNIKGRARRLAISNKLYDVMTRLVFESSDYQKTLFQSMLDSKKINGGGHVIAEDINRSPINYRDFIRRSFIFGHHFSKSSNHGEHIGLFLPNSIAVMVCFFGLHSHGRIPAMLNYSTGIRDILSACKAASLNNIISSRSFIEKADLHEAINALTKAGITVHYLEDLKDQIRFIDKVIGFSFALFPNYFYRELTAGAKPTDPAVILFTSGSEGVPKGVVLSHQNIQANRYQLSAKIDFTSQDIVFNSLPVFHTFGLNGGSLLPFLFGIRTFFYPSPLHYRIIPELIYDTNATIVFGTDTFLRNYATYAHPYDFYAVRYIFAGAEKLTPETQKLWVDKFGVRILEGYGATETSPVISTNTPMQYKKETVGRILPGIDYQLQAVEGVEDGGRLFVSGPNIMLGYLFETNPGEIMPPKDGWYDTGDIIHIDEDGYLTILGRAKRFAKIAGEMISLTAVELAVYELWPDFYHAVVAKQDAKRGEVLVLVTNKSDANKEELIAHFRTKGMSDLSIPRSIQTVKDFPLLPTGKTDYKQIMQLL